MTFMNSVQFSSIQSLSCVQLFATPWIAAHQTFLSITNSQSLFKLMSIKSVMPSNHLFFCHPLLLLPSILCRMGSFQMTQLFTSGSQSIGVSASTLAFQMNIQNWFPFGWTGAIPLQSKGLSRVSSNITVQKQQFFSAQSSLWSNSHVHTTIGKTIPLTTRPFVCKVLSLLLNTLSRFVIAFLPRSKHLLISWLQSLQWFWILRK